MRRKPQYGKQVYNKFFLREHYSTREYFEQQINTTVQYIQKSPSLFRNQKIGIIKVFRNKRGARIIAYDLPEEEKS